MQDDIRRRLGQGEFEAVNHVLIGRYSVPGLMADLAEKSAHRRELAEVAVKLPFPLRHVPASAPDAVPSRMLTASHLLIDPAQDAIQLLDRFSDVFLLHNQRRRE